MATFVCRGYFVFHFFFFVPIPHLPQYMYEKQRNEVLLNGLFTCCRLFAGAQFILESILRWGIAGERNLQWRYLGLVALWQPECFSKGERREN